MTQSLHNALQDWTAQQPQSRTGISAAEAAARARMDREQERLIVDTPEDADKRRRADLTRMGVAAIASVLERVDKDIRKTEQKRQLLEIPEIYLAHSNLLIRIANKVLAYQHRKFVVDDNNRNILRFMLYYFNDCPLAEEVFPERGYKLHKHIMLQGNVGTGKTLLMEIFSEYLRYTNNPNFYYNLSVTQMINYYTLHNNLDRYTFNEEENKGFRCKPVNICLNDIGVQTTTFYGMDTKVLTDEFLHARNEIWSQFHLKAHVTTNLSIEQLKEKYKDGFGRLIDRFKTYNVIPITGTSRR